MKPRVRCGSASEGSRSKRPVRRVGGELEGVVDGQRRVPGRHGIAHGQRGPRPCHVRVGLEYPLEALHRLEETRRRASVPVIAALEVELVGVGGAAVGARRRLTELGGERAAERPGDGVRDVVLDPEQVLTIVVEAVGPEVAAGAGIDQLRHYPRPAAGAADAALEHRVDPQELGDLADVCVAVLEVEDRGPRHHSETGDVGEQVDQVLGQTVGEDLGRLVAVEVGEGQHRDRPRAVLKRHLGSVLVGRDPPSRRRARRRRRRLSPGSRAPAGEPAASRAAPTAGRCGPRPGGVRRWPSSP